MGQLPPAAESDPFDEATYLVALETARRIGGAEGIDAALQADNLDALVAPTGSPAWPNDLVNGDHFLGASSGPAAIAGYPIINVPAGDAFGLPVGISFMGTAWSEPTLIKLSSGFEAVSKARKTPKFLPTLPTDTGGVSPKPRTLGSPMAHSSGPARSSNPVTGRI